MRMSYNLNRLVNLLILLSGNISSKQLFEVILKESMFISNCDGGTLYMVEGDELVFRHVYTKSKYVEMDSSSGATLIPPVPMERSYVCAYCAMLQKKMNIPDVYRSNEFDFSGTKKYDKMNNYRTQSMLVMPLVVADGDVMGVIQLINSMDGEGRVMPFTADQERLVSAVCSIAAIYIDHWVIKRRLHKMEKEKKDE